MFEQLPQDVTPFINWPMAQIQLFYDDLLARPLTADTIDQWLTDWSRLTMLLAERGSRLYVANSQDTTDAAAEKRMFAFLEEIRPVAAALDQQLKQKFLESGLEPAGMERPLSKMRTEAALFRQENLPLFTEEAKLGTHYNKIIGAQTVEWQGQEYTLTQLSPHFHTPDQEVREQIWRRITTRQLADRQAINENWRQLFHLRQQIAANAGFDNYRAYAWKAKHRTAYNPDDAQTFLQAIEQVVVPASTRVYQRYQQRLGLAALRPWDISGDTYLLTFDDKKLFADGPELAQKAAAVLHHVDPELGQRFELMRQENLLDLDNRKGKAPGGYCTNYPVSQRPFIFMNAVGMKNDVRTILHESGHAFHDFEMYPLRYIWQHSIGMEIAEVASMSMELLSFPYLTQEFGGYFDDETVKAYKQNQLEHILLFWPYMAVVDGFQHWVYTSGNAAADPDNCDAAWGDLWDRYMPTLDYTGLEAVKVTGWHRKLHIHRAPFYYIEYGLAQVGAVHVWRNALHNQAEAVRRYRQALALGGTHDLPHLYHAAGAKFSFDAAAMNDVVSLLENQLEGLRG